MRRACKKKETGSSILSTRRGFMSSLEREIGPLSINTFRIGWPRLSQISKLRNNLREMNPRY